MKDLKNIELTLSSMSEDDKKILCDNLRFEYREISAYTIHYSNMRSALFVFLMGSAFYVLSHQFELPKENRSLEIYISGLLFAILSNVFNIELTRLMQIGLRNLSDIEKILSIITKTNKDKNEDQVMNFFTCWKPSPGKYSIAVTERFTILFLIILIVYLIFFVCGLYELGFLPCSSR